MIKTAENHAKQAPRPPRTPGLAEAHPALRHRREVAPDPGQIINIPIPTRALAAL